MARVGHALTRRRPPGLDTNAGDADRTQHGAGTHTRPDPSATLQQQGPATPQLTVIIYRTPSHTSKSQRRTISSLAHQHLASQPSPTPQTTQSNNVVLPVPPRDRRLCWRCPLLQHLLSSIRCSHHHHWQPRRYPRDPTHQQRPRDPQVRCRQQHWPQGQPPDQLVPCY